MTETSNARARCETAAVKNQQKYFLLKSFSREKKINTLFAGLGRSVLEKLCPWS